ncbi:DUF3734 domain-containing protein [Ramlibacter sp. H39-3-26]|uniref:DUF3734 domain-containing protein n=1 Tax=Curvibacter soli TaxID=3031331 RepID=UPI0023D9A087|nr:DUF3734 domain-containing protein [Ramlibacter sp. H39-3-26]MDF1485979.1 DUF3734 domain-containing protein [Ramlibacter sp. H39-3-26]
MARVKGIQYSSRTRTRMNTEAAAANVNLKQRLARLPERLPAHLRCAAQPDGATTYDLGEPSVARIRHPGGRT